MSRKQPKPLPTPPRAKGPNSKSKPSTKRSLSPEEIEALLQKLLELLTKSPSQEAIKETDNLVDWMIENVPKGLNWIGENILPHLPSLLAFLI